MDLHLRPFSGISLIYYYYFPKVMFGSMEISHGPKDIKLRVRPLSSTYCAWLVLSGGQSHCCIQKGGPGQPTLQAAEDQEVWAHPASKFQVEKALTTHFTDEKLDIK